MNRAAQFHPCLKYLQEKPAALLPTISRSSPETRNWDILSTNARSHLDGTQSNHVSPAGLSAVSTEPLRKTHDFFSDCFCFCRRAGRSFSLQPLGGSESRADLHRDGVHRLFRLPLLLCHGQKTQQLTDRVAKMQEHQNEAGKNRETGKPSKNLRSLFFRVAHR